MGEIIATVTTILNTSGAHDVIVQMPNSQSNASNLGRGDRILSNHSNTCLSLFIFFMCAFLFAVIYFFVFAPNFLVYTHNS